MVTIKSVVLIIVAVVVVMSFIGASSSTMLTAARSISANANCSTYKDTAGQSYVYNVTSANCDNSTVGSPSVWSPASFKNLPLSALFNDSGVVLTIVMAGLLLVIIGIVIKKKYG